MSHTEQEIMLGNVAIARGLVEGGIDVMTAYPGTPSSEILPGVLDFRDRDNLPIYIEWSVNEKVALDVALGAAFAGKWATAAMKQVGFNVALDAAIHARDIPIKGAFVIISADDPGPHSSQTEQDTRQIAMIEGFAVLDPSSPQEAKEMAAYALTLSHKFGVPIILRPVNRVSHARQNVPLGPIKKKVEDPPVDVTTLSFEERMALLAEEVEKNPPFTELSTEKFSQNSLRTFNKTSGSCTNIYSVPADRLIGEIGVETDNPIHVIGEDENLSFIGYVAPRVDEVDIKWLD